MKNMHFIGRITKDAILNTRKIGQDDVPVTNFNVAVNTPAGRDEQGKQQYTTDYFSVSLWRKQATAMVPFLKKGRLVYVEGDFRLETWLGRQDQKVHPIAHLTSPTIQFLDKPSAQVEEEPSADVVAQAAETLAAETDPEELPFD